MFTKRELKLIESALLAYGVGEDETVYIKLDRFKFPRKKIKCNNCKCDNSCKC